MAIKRLVVVLLLVVLALVMVVLLMLLVLLVLHIMLVMARSRGALAILRASLSIFINIIH